MQAREISSGPVPLLDEPENQAPPPPPPPPPPADGVDPLPPGCGAVPADPHAPGFHADPVDPGPNGFQLGVEGPDPLLLPAGTHDQQEYQRDRLIELSGMAALSYATGHIEGAPRLPPDADVRAKLGELSPNPPIGADGIDVTHAVYQSHIPSATPQEAYDHFVNNPGEVFSAGGMEIRPPTQRLEDGGRYMLEIGGPVPAWLPVEIELDPASKAVTINTLDGHVLRGSQTFTFTDDCAGGTTLTQDAHFQASSRLPDELQELTSISNGQHQTWQNAHREIYEQFNGDRGYEGIGTDLFNRQQIDSWVEAGTRIVVDPGNAADVGIDSGGEVANWALDQVGLDGAGDWVSTEADHLGDRVEWVIDGLNPFG